MTIRRAIFGVLMGIGLGLFDAIFATFLPSPFSAIRLALPVIAFCIAIERPAVGLLIAGFAGLVFDLFAVGGSGFAVARTAAAAGAAVLLQKNVLTNRSLYATILLALVVRIADTAWLAASAGLTMLFRLPLVSLPTWDSIWRRAIADVLVVSFLFLIHSLFMRGFAIFRRRRS